MKKFIAVLCIAGLLLAGCMGTITGNGKSKTTSYEESGFTKLNASYGFQVSIEPSDEYSIEVTCDENLMDYLEVDVKGDTLELGLADGRIYKNATLKAIVKMPDIESLDGSGGSMLTLKEGFVFDHSFNLNLSGGSTLTGNVDTGNLNLDFSGGSEATLSGSGKNLDATLSGGSILNFYNYLIGNGTFNLSGGSHAKINANGELDITGSGGSEFYYKGEGVVKNQNLSGGSVIHKKN